MSSKIVAPNIFIAVKHSMRVLLSLVAESFEAKL